MPRGIYPHKKGIKHPHAGSHAARPGSRGARPKAHHPHKAYVHKTGYKIHRVAPYKKGIKHKAYVHKRGYKIKRVAAYRRGYHLKHKRVGR